MSAERRRLLELNFILLDAACVSASFFIAYWIRGIAMNRVGAIRNDQRDFPLQPPFVGGAITAGEIGDVVHQDLA